MQIIGHCAEKLALGELLDRVRAGMSRVLVLRGEPGIGKSALLDHAVERAGDLQVLRTVAAESETRVGFAALHQLLMPLLGGVDRLPDPQRRALEVAFGSVSGPPADPFRVGLAVLTLLSDAAERRPVLCVVDDAQWLDGPSADVLSFAARRLLDDRVGMLFALQEISEPTPRFRALPALRIAGLPRRDAHGLLAAAVDQPLDRAVAERIVAETGGNPLALLEVTRALTATQRSGDTPLPEPLPLGHRLDGAFVRPVRELPPDTQALLLLAAADHPGWGNRLWKAAAAMGIAESVATPAEAAGLAVFWPEVRFGHPLVRSAVYHGATPARRRQLHRALAAASDPKLDADARAWHLAKAALGPDERVAAEQEAAAERARLRGGYAVAAALLERAALLTPDQWRRAERRLLAAEADLLAGAADRADALLARALPGLSDPLSRAQAVRMAGMIQLVRGQPAEASSTLLRAAKDLRPRDARSARQALLSALEATVSAGWSASHTVLHEIARTADELSGIDSPEASPADVLLTGYTTLVTTGYVAAVPGLRRAVGMFLAEDVDVEVSLQRLGLAVIAAGGLWEDDALDRLTTRWVQLARDSGAKSRLAVALRYRGCFADAPSGRLAAARAATAEAVELAEATGKPGLVGPCGVRENVLALALSGREAQTRATAAALIRAGTDRNAPGLALFAAYSLGILELGLGDYQAAVSHLQQVGSHNDPLLGTHALPELVEAAVRAGRLNLAESACSRFGRQAQASGTPLALGLLARSQALLAAPGPAQALYEEAIGYLGRSRTSPQLARAHLLYGEWLRRQRRRREARDHLRIAHDMLDAIGLDGFATRARVELGATGEHARKRDSGVTEQLTPQEAQIAALVSRGEANRDIAAQLVISPSTVEYHLRKVFRKVGVSSRTQLARRIVDDDVDVLRPA